MGSDGNSEPRLSHGHALAALRSPLRRAGFVALATAAAGAALIVPFNLCLMALVLDLPCPGCGMTRAAKALLHGDFARAVTLHPLSPLVVPLAATLLASHAVRYVRDGAPIATGRIPRSLELVCAALALLLFGVWIARFFGFFGGPVSVH